MSASGGLRNEHVRVHGDEMSIDIMTAFRTEQATGVVRTLLTDWWELDEFRETATIAEILAVLRRDEINRRIPWRQDRILPMSESRQINGSEVVVVENQGLWEATIAPGTSDADASVALYMEDRSLQGTVVVVKHHRIDGSMALAELVMRLLVENAVSLLDDSSYEARPNFEELTHYLLVPELSLEPGYANFPALVAANGWFGMISRGGTLITKMTCEPTEVMALGIAEDWLKYGPAGPPATPNPNPNIWSRRTDEVWYGWLPIRSDGQPDETRPSHSRFGSAG